MTRLPPLDEKDPELSAVLTELAASRGKVSSALRCMGHAPEALRRFASVGDYARYHSSLSEKLREMVIIITGRNTPYALSYHIPLGLQAGLTQAEVDALCAGKVPSSFDTRERAVAEYVFEFTSAQSVSDTTFEALRRFMTPREVTDVSMTSAYYAALAMIVTAMGVTGDPPERIREELVWQLKRDQQR